jgi:DNA polymerase I
MDMLDADIARMRDAMAEASRIVLKGFELGTDVSIVRYPDRYSDKRGVKMWAEVTSLVSRINMTAVVV